MAKDERERLNLIPDQPAEGAKGNLRAYWWKVIAWFVCQCSSVHHQPGARSGSG